MFRYLLHPCCWFCNNLAEREESSRQHVHITTETLDNELRHKCGLWQVGLQDKKMICQTIKPYCGRLTSHCLARVVIGMPLCPRGTNILYAAY